MMNSGLGRFLVLPCTVALLLGSLVVRAFGSQYSPHSLMLYESPAVNLASGGFYDPGIETLSHILQLRPDSRTTGEAASSWCGLGGDLPFIYFNFECVGDSNRRFDLRMFRDDSCTDPLNTLSDVWMPTDGPCEQLWSGEYSPLATPPYSPYSNPTELWEVIVCSLEKQVGEIVAYENSTGESLFVRYVLWDGPSEGCSAHISYQEPLHIHRRLGANWGPLSENDMTIALQDETWPVVSASVESFRVFCLANGSYLYRYYDNNDPNIVVGEFVVENGTCVNDRWSIPGACFGGRICYGKESFDACSGPENGVCLANGSCVCFANHSGSECEDFECFGVDRNDSAVCNGNGTCVGHGRCLCDAGYSGPACNDFSCGSLGHCNGHGTCVGPSVCLCDSPGYDTTPHCGWECHGEPMDSPNACVAYEGGICVDTDTCNCSGVEYCSTGKCDYKCNPYASMAPFQCYGINYDQNETTDSAGLFPPFWDRVCNGHGLCVAEDTCVCEAGFDLLPQCGWQCFGMFMHWDSVACGGQPGGICVGPDTCLCSPREWVDWDRVGTTAGEQCELISCFGKWSNETGDVCSGNGKCVEYNMCECEDGYALPDCRDFGCFGYPANANWTIGSGDDPRSAWGRVCSNSGYCVGPDQCVCNTEDNKFHDCSDFSCFGVSRWDEASSCGGPDFECVGTDLCVCGEGQAPASSVCSSDPPTCDDGPTPADRACNGHGTCMRQPWGAVECQCEPSYEMGNWCRFRCDNLYPGDAGVCSDRGNCTDIETCECEPGFAGTYCDEMGCFGIVHDEFLACGLNGTCVGPDNCSCTFPYNESEKCDWRCFGELRDSMDTVCSGHGVCGDVDSCACQPGYESPDCSQYSCFGVNHTLEWVCSGAGNCSAPDHCDCTNSSVGGLTCNQTACFGVVATNAGVVCSGHGQCREPGNCSCEANYTGNNCEKWECFQVLRNATDVVCNGRGECMSHNNCSCENGFVGGECEAFTCDGVMSNDSSVVCSGYGRCVYADTCVCETVVNVEQLYWGDFCEEWECGGPGGMHDRFDSDACFGRGNCTDVGVCECEGNWTGYACHLISCYGKSEADPLVCNGHGQCVSFDNCSCEHSYGGHDCTPGHNCSTLNGCSGHGSCTAPQTCSCHADYGLDDCSLERCHGLLATDAAVCGGASHGSCVDVNSCDCLSGWKGDSNCSLWSCDAIECVHGTCAGPNLCDCESGWRGNTNCSGWSCDGEYACYAVGGDCISNNTCQCHVGYSGPVCDVFNCSFVNDCSGRGVCIGAQLCDCVPGVSGADCSDWNCSSVGDCSGHGACVGPSFCSCFPAFFPPMCDTSSCSPSCSAYGKCVSPNVCACLDSRYYGSRCFLFNCSGVTDGIDDCGSHGDCVKPKLCKCHEGYGGLDCRSPLAGGGGGFGVFGDVAVPAFAALSGVLLLVVLVLVVSVFLLICCYSKRQPTTVVPAALSDVELQSKEDDIREVTELRARVAKLEEELKESKQLHHSREEEEPQQQKADTIGAGSVKDEKDASGDGGDDSSDSSDSSDDDSSSKDRSEDGEDGEDS